MRLIFVMFLGCVVYCDDSYYVIQMPDPESRQLKRPFRVYWNVPTMQCTSKKILFKNLYENFGIIQNKNDSFRGDEIVILYDPGKFPAIFNEGGGKVRYRNGGVPQEGNLKEHLDAFRNEMEQSIPDKEFSGIGIIDFESWRPVFRQNFGVLTPYKDVSYEIESEAHWWWPKTWIRAEAKRRFEEAGRIFMQNTISVAKQLRPNARWGYYGFPYCFNMAASDMAEKCADKVSVENDNIDWLWSESSALYPSVYSSQFLSSNQLARLVRGRVMETSRVKRGGTVVLPYFWFRYRDGGFLRKEDLLTVLETFQETKASGFLIWGSSSDVNTVEKCIKLLNYTENILGPAIAKYTKYHKQVLYEENENSTAANSSTTINPFESDNTLLNVTEESSILNVNESTIDPEYDFVPPENYTQEIIELAEELTQNDTRIVKEPVLVSNDSVLTDILKQIISQIELDSNPSKVVNEAESEDTNLFNSGIVSTLLPPIESTNTYDLETSTYIDLREYTEEDIELLSTTENYESTTSTKNNDNYSTTEELNLYTTEANKKSTTDNLFSNEHTLFNSYLDYTTRTDEVTESMEYIDVASTTKLTNEEMTDESITETTTESILIKVLKQDTTNNHKLKQKAAIENLETEIILNDKNIVSTETNIFTKNPVAYKNVDIAITTEAGVTAKLFINDAQNEHTNIYPNNEELLVNDASSLVNASEKTKIEESQNKNNRNKLKRTVADAEVAEEGFSKHDQVAGSASTRPRYYFCLFFYFYSVTKCLCDKQCT